MTCNAFCVSMSLDMSRLARKLPRISNLKYKIWAHRPSIKGTKPLFIVIKAIIIILHMSCTCRDSSTQENALHVQPNAFGVSFNQVLQSTLSGFVCHSSTFSCVDDSWRDRSLHRYCILLFRCLSTGNAFSFVDNSSKTLHRYSILE